MRQQVRCSRNGRPASECLYRSSTGRTRLDNARIRQVHEIYIKKIVDIPHHCFEMCDTLAVVTPSGVVTPVGTVTPVGAVVDSNRDVSNSCDTVTIEPVKPKKMVVDWVCGDCHQHFSRKATLKRHAGRFHKASQPSSTPEHTVVSGVRRKRTTVQSRKLKSIPTKAIRDFVDSILPPMVPTPGAVKKTPIKKKAYKKTNCSCGWDNTAHQLAADETKDAPEIKIEQVVGWYPPNSGASDRAILADEYGLTPVERFSLAGIVEPVNASMYKVVADASGWVGWDEATNMYTLPIVSGDYVAIIHST